MTVLIDIDQFTDQFDIIALCVRASHVDVIAGDSTLTHPRFSTLRGLVFNGTRYDDHVAACACHSMTVYKFADFLYTRCDLHGFQQAGTLRREIKRKK